MHIAFYAPLKPPGHPVPSGDRRMARLLMQAMRSAGHRVTIASRLRSYDGQGDAKRQDVIRRRAARVAQTYIGKTKGENRPDIWFTYHVYHKAPDLLGPSIAEALALPYVVAEASYAPKQKDGPWRRGHADVAVALRRAARIIMLNPDDAPCVRALIDDNDNGRRITTLAPFIDTRSARAAAGARAAYRVDFARRLGLNPDIPWLVVTAMLRGGDKQHSYCVLAGIIRRLRETPLHLLIAGDGPARAEIKGFFGDDPRIHWLGEIPAPEIDALHAAADLVVWPAIREAYGMALLEAQAAGVPVIAGGAPGVRQIVAHGETGLIVPMDCESLEPCMTEAVSDLLNDPKRRRAMGAAALERARRRHDIDTAAKRLNKILEDVI
jgi:glycosyltransferase involved in cell wall biosynthesis